MTKYSLILLFVLAGCSSTTMPTPSNLLIGPDPIPYPVPIPTPIAEDTSLCSWRDARVAEYVAQTCPNGMPACVAAHLIPTITTLTNGLKVYIEDKGYAPFYKVSDYPSAWCHS